MLRSLSVICLCYLSILLNCVINRSRVGLYCVRSVRVSSINGVVLTDSKEVLHLPASHFLVRTSVASSTLLYSTFR